MGFAETVRDAWNTRSPEAIADLYSAGGVRVATAFPETRYDGRAELIAHVTEILTAVPDASLELRGATDDGGTLAIEWTFVGTQTADFGPIPGRGQAVALKGVSVIALADDGRIAEERVYWDTATLMAGGGMLG